MIDASRRRQLLSWATYASVSVASVLIVLKTWAWLAGGSVSILASLVDSLMDAGASVINLLAVRIALQPADDNHSFGHGKAESLSALVQSAFITGSAVFLLLNAADRLLHPQALNHTGLGMVVMGVSLGLTLALVLFQRWVLRQTESTAIAADSLHYLSDFLSNAVVLLALFLSGLGFVHADAILAALIGLWILKSAWDILSEAIHHLMDHALPEADLARIQAAVLATPGVLGVHDVRTRLSGSVRFVQMHIELADDLSVLAGHEIAEAVEHNVGALFEQSEVIVHQDPVSVVDKARAATQEPLTD